MARSTAGRALALGLCLAASLAGCSSTTRGTAAGTSAASRGGGSLSIVSMGDSIASGEGIDYGYRYTTNPVGHWYGGSVNVVWEGPYPLCHVSAQAYGDVVAASLHARFDNFACTGSSYLNGIVGPRTLRSGATTVTYRPAQFGDWQARTDLNPSYDAARPDVVLVTLGADDVHFVEIVESCVADSVFDPSACTAANPGATIQQDYFAQLPALRAHYRQLAQAIQARGRAAHPAKVPYVVFTTYPDPLPPPGADLSVTSCPDAAHLSAAQVAYLSQLLSGVAGVLHSALSGQRGVAVADVTSVFNGHRFCSADPWAYGPSVLLTNPLSQAPFHPTPRGQRAIAAAVSPVVQRAAGAR